MVKMGDADAREARRPWGRWVLALAGYLALTAVMTYPLVREFGRAIPGDGFDGWQNYWNLWWVRLSSVERGISPFFTDMLYYPTGVSLVFQTMNIFNGLFTLPVQVLAGLIPAYNSVVVLSFVAGALGAMLLARWVLAHAGWRGDGAWGAAFLAGVVYAFSPFHFAHLLGHMQVFSLEWIPFAAWALVRGMERLGSRPSSWKELLCLAGLAGLFLILVGMCDWYFAMYLAFFTVILAIYPLAGRRLARRQVAFLGLAWGIFLLVLSPLWVSMVREAARASYMVPAEEQAVQLSADLLAFFTPNEFHPLWGETAAGFAGRFTSTTSERIVFAGYVPLLLAVLAAWKAGRPGRFWWIVVGVFFLCALGPVLHVGGRSEFGAGGWRIPLPYMLIYRYVPFVRIARSIARFDVMVMLGLSVLSALGLAWVLSRCRPGGRWALSLTAVGLVCFEFLSVPYPFSPPDTPAFYRELAQEPGEFAVLNLPMNWDRPGYLLYQTVHGKPLTAGYISREDPHTLVYRTPVLQEWRFLGPDILADEPAALAPAVFDWMKIRYVVLDRYKMPSGAEREVTAALADAIFAGTAPAYEDERLTAYRVPEPAPGALRPFAVLGDGWGERVVEGSRVYREVDGEAGLLVVVPNPDPDKKLRLAVKAAGSPGAVLSIVAPAGEMSQMPLSDEILDINMEWGPAGDEERITLECAGSAPCRVYRVDVEQVK